MRTKLLTSAIIAVILPTTALASVATEQAFSQLSQPLNKEKAIETNQLDSKQVSNTLGQSDAATRAFYYVSVGTEHKTSFPQNDHGNSDIGKPLDW